MLITTADFAMPFLQGLPVLARNPVIWTRMTAKHYEAFFDPTVQARYIKDHMDTFREMAQYGVPIGDTEFFAALQRGGTFELGRPLELLPKGAALRRTARGAGKQTFGRFQSSYNAGLAVARSQLWDAASPSWADKSELAALIRNMTGGLQSRALGVGPSQRASEGMWMAFSPQYLRSTVALFYDATRLNTKRGRESARVLAQWVGGAHSIFVLAGLAMGKTDEEIKRGLNPLNGKEYLSYRINGDWIGVGSQIRGLTQLTAGLVSAVAPGGKPLGDLATAYRWENPFVNFMMGRASFATRAGLPVLEHITGANVDPFSKVDTLPDLAQHLFTAQLPVAIQGALEGEKPLTAVIGSIGARTSPPSAADLARTGIGGGGGGRSPGGAFERALAGGSGLPQQRSQTGGAFERALAGRSGTPQRGSQAGGAFERALSLQR